MGEMYNRAADTSQERMMMSQTLQRMRLAEEAMAKAQYVVASIAPSDPGYNGVVDFRYRYEVVKRCQHHLLCRYTASGVMRSFTFADILTGWVRCI